MIDVIDDREILHDDRLFDGVGDPAVERQHRLIGRLRHQRRGNHHPGRPTGERRLAQRNAGSRVLVAGPDHDRHAPVDAFP